LKTYGITQVFLSLHSGLTRWVTILDDGDATYFKNNHKKAIDELWYQRAVELQTKDGTYVYSVPFSDERGNPLTINTNVNISCAGDNVTATAAIFIDSKKVPVAVVGYRIQYPNLHSLFTRYTSKPFQHALHLVEWIIGTTIWLFTQTNLWLESSTFAAKVKPTQLPRDDVKINRTHLEPCVKQVDLYHLQNHTYPDPKVPFVVQKVAHSNLILVVVDTLCGDDPDMEVQIVRREVDDTEMVGCLNALNANLTRKRPKVCVGKADKGKKVSKI
ncbi:hypothetical protein C0J52_14167, partial [Blattella germanica]